MAAHGEIRWPPLGRFNGRLWGESHGRRQADSELKRGIDLSPVNRRSPKGGAIYGNRRFGGFWRFGAKAGNRRFWPFSWQSRESTVLADSELKRGIGVLADLGLKGESTCLPENRRSPKGVPIFGKSVIRTICRKSAICGCQRATGAMLLMMRTSVLRWPVRVPFPSCFSSSRRGCWDRLSRSKQTAAMAGAICGPKVSSAQCFRRIATETWRVAAHGQWAGGGRSWRLGR
jgi:hypothetical protein